MGSDTITRCVLIGGDVGCFVCLFGLVLVFCLFVFRTVFLCVALAALELAL